MGKHGDFYAIDRRTWALVCNRGMNPAVAYNVLAAFSGKDNTNTDASTNAVEKYTGISRSRASAAIEDLVASGFVKRTKVGTRPHHELVSYAELPGVKLYDVTRLETWEQRLVNYVADGGHPTKPQQNRVDKLVDLGVLQKSDGRYIVRPPPDPKPDLIWLPNDLVTGTPKRETSPVERVRQTDDVLCLRLLVDLYHAQNLTDDGGISRGVIFKKYERTKVAEVSTFAVWSFKGKENEPTVWSHCEIASPHVVPKKDGQSDFSGFWTRLRVLEETGLIEWVRYLAESDKPTAELVHPMGMITKPSGTTTPPEETVAPAAYNAATYLLGRINQSQPADSLWLVPALRHQANVTMVGVARLRYRPRTANASRWYAELTAGCAYWKEHYDAMAAGDFSRVKATG